jgi:hypothetical protein
MNRLALRIGGLALLAGALGLSGCAVSRYHLTDDYGRAVRQDLAAQIADPDARYKGDPAPASSGLRTTIAQKAYEAGTVKAPAAPSTSSVAGSGGQ